MATYLGEWKIALLSGGGRQQKKIWKGNGILLWQIPIVKTQKRQNRFKEGEKEPEEGWEEEGKCRVRGKKPANDSEKEGIINRGGEVAAAEEGIEWLSEPVLEPEHGEQRQRQFGVVAMNSW